MDIRSDLVTLNHNPVAPGKIIPYYTIAHRCLPKSLIVLLSFIMGWVFFLLISRNIVAVMINVVAYHKWDRLEKSIDSMMVIVEVVAQISHGIELMIVKCGKLSVYSLALGPSNYKLIKLVNDFIQWIGSIEEISIHG